MEAADLIGRWTIVRWRQEYDDGRRTYPMGEEVAGFIDYRVDGTMAVILARRDRAPFTSGGQWDASDAEKAAAYDGMLSYCGTYAVAGDTIEHRIELSLFPNWQGATQRRRAAMVDGELHLTARIEEGTPQARTIALVWRRA